VSYTVDLHTHSYGSPDGGLMVRDYRYFLENKLLDYIAITDHNSIEAALAIKTELGDLGKRIIVGEEVQASQGELIGLFLTEPIPAGLSPLKTAEAIHAQGGLVYVPHPFETVRKGVPMKALNEIEEHVDIVEVWNGRAYFENRKKMAKVWARQNEKPVAASSDAHGRFGWGRTYSVIEQALTAKNLSAQLAKASFSTQGVGVGVLYPKFNWLMKRLGR
jgi:predicted metal-dependent phosphoesterase TrpH